MNPVIPATEPKLLTNKYRNKRGNARHALPTYACQGETDTQSENAGGRTSAKSESWGGNNSCLSPAALCNSSFE